MKTTKLIFNAVLLISFSIFLISNSFAQSCPDDMISHWKLQEASGPDYLDSYGSHDAIATSSAPSQTAGISGKGQFFNASQTTSITVEDHSDFDWSGTSCFSIELWVKFTEIGETRVFIGRDDPTSEVHWWIGHDDTGKIRWYLKDDDGGSSDITSTSAYNTGQWVHIVAVRDSSGDVNSLFVNAGAPATSTVDFDGNFSSSAPINLGYLNVDSSPDYYYTGGIDEVAIYNRALGGSEITDHYDNLSLYKIGYCDGNIPVILTDPKIYATVGQTYTYNVDASANPQAIYSLVEKPSGMTISTVEGEILWTPASATENSHVIIRATNDSGYVEQEFNIYLSDQPVCRDSLLAYWDFDDSGTPQIDNIEGYELNGTSLATATGIVNGALSFNGTNDMLNMEDSYTFPELIFFDFDDVPDFSFEVWMKSDASPSNVMVLIGRESTGNDTQYWLGINTNGTARFLLKDYNGTMFNIQGGSSVLDNEWHHIVATYNSATDAMKLYVDTILVDQTTQNFLNFGCSDDLNIGYLNTSTDKFWYEGLMDELSFYDTVLSASNIGDNFKAAKAGDGACVYNYAPVILTSPDLEGEQGDLYEYQIEATDIDAGDVITLSAETKPAWLNFSFTPGATTALLSGTPANSDVGFHDIVIRVSDGDIDVDQEFTIEVKNINDDPYFTSNPITDATQGTEYVYAVVVVDDDGDDLTVSVITLPDWLELTAGNLIGTPDNDDVKTHAVTLRVSDGILETDQSFSIIVANINDAPVISSTPSLFAAYGVEYIYHLTAMDPDGDALTYSKVYVPGWLNFDAATAILSGTPTEANSGDNAVILQVSDGTANTLDNFIISVGITALDDNNSDLELLVYPNPAQNNVNFNFYNFGTKRIVIYNMAGSVLKDVLTDETKNISVNISEFPQGLYIYKVYYNNEIITGKFTKKH